MKLGGPLDLALAVRGESLEAGPATIWVTAGVERWGWGYLDAFFAACKREALTPLVSFWTFGDSIGPNVFSTGVADKYQVGNDGKPIWITKAKCRAWALEIARRALAAGVSPIVAIEPEGTKNGVAAAPAEFAGYWNDIASNLKATHPGIRVVFASALWNDQALIARNFAPQIASADLIGLQTLLFRPRHGEAEFLEAGPRLAAKFKALVGSSGKPVALIDVGFSSHGGPYAAAHPFAGGNGWDGEGLQRQAIESLQAVAALGLEFMCYRSLQDNPNFNVANYGGYAERHIGVMRSDRSEKPAYTALLALGVKDLPARLAAAEAALKAAQAVVAGQAADIEDLQGRLARIRDLAS